MKTSQYEPAIPGMALYVPAPGSLIESLVLPRSALVGVDHPNGSIRCYYEGGKYGPMDFAERLSLACGRLSERAPTTSFAVVKADELVLVGSAKWDAVLSAWIIDNISDPVAFKAWTGDDAVVGGTRAQHERAAGMLVSKGPNAQAMVAWQTAISANRDPVEALIEWARNQV